jgi:hypothetical protein
MLRRDLARAILKLPRRIGEDRPELLPPRRSEQADCGFGEWVDEENITRPIVLC